MARWCRLWTKLYHYHHPVIGICGLLATVVVSSPGTSQITVGSIQLDAFYISVVAFGALLVLSVIDEYDPDDYSLESSESER